MKRLSVRLSIVGAVVALGGAAIAYSLLSKPEAESPAQGTPDPAVAENAETQPPAPIRSDEDTPPEPQSAGRLQPPPSSLFDRSGAHQTVSHESPAAEASEGEPSQEDSADALPPADPVVGNYGYNTGFPVDEPAHGASASPSDGSTVASSADASSTDESSDSSSAFPAEPNYSSSASSSAPLAAETGEDYPAAETRGGIGPPPGGFAVVPRADHVADTTSAGLETKSGVTGDHAFDPTTPVRNAAGTYPAASVRPVSAASDDSSVADPPIADATEDRAVPGNATARAGLTAGAAAAVAAESVGGAASTALNAGIATAESTAMATSNASSSATPGRSTDSALTRSPLGTDAPTPGTYPSTGAGLAGSDTGFASPTQPNGSSNNSLSTRSVPTGASSGNQPTASASDNSMSVSAAAGSGVSGGVSGAGGAYTGETTQLALDLPGERVLEGQQSPAIVIEKLAPEEIQVERKATFQVKVRNTGTAPAHNVIVVDRVPRGTEFVDALPAVAPGADGSVVWRVEMLKPGEEVVLSMNLLPKVAGEIGSVAQATFQTQASVRAICTKPQLELSVVAPEEVLIGQPATLEITVTNTGNGAAENVVLEEDVPEGFVHAAGQELQSALGRLAPQESRRLTLVLDSAKPGSYENHLSVRGEGNLFDEDVRAIHVTAPQLQVAMQGPTLRYLDRQATYSVHLANPGSAAARNVELVTYLPKGMKYVTSDNQGQYDTQTHAVYWSLEELPPEKQGDVHFTVLPVEPGNHKLKADSRADLGLKQACEHEVVVEGLAELAFSVADVADPIELGSETGYEIRIQNRGSKPDTNVQLLAELPEGITPTTGDGPTQATVQGQRVLFAPLAQLGPGDEAIFKIHAQGVTIGDHVVRVQVRSAELRVPVTKEEITRVYSDK